MTNETDPLFAILETEATREQHEREAAVLRSRDCYWTAAARALDANAKPPTPQDVAELRDALRILGRTTADLRQHVADLRRLKAIRKDYDPEQARAAEREVSTAAVAARAEVDRLRAEADQLETRTRLAIAEAKDRTEECRRQALIADKLRDALLAAGCDRSHDDLVQPPPPSGQPRQFVVTSDTFWHGATQLRKGDVLTTTHATAGIEELPVPHIVLKKQNLGGTVYDAGSVVSWPPSEGSPILVPLPPELEQFSDEGRAAWARQQVEASRG